MLIDLHAHTSGISHCCRIPFETVLQQTLAYGMDGIVLTNHYTKDYIKDGAVRDFAERYIEEFITTQQYGDRIGCKVFFGVEVTMELYPKVHMLIYGADPDFLRENPRMFDCTQEELYRLVKANNGVLIQAHPFRNGTTVLNTAYMDGIEINCHPLYGNSYSKKLLQIARNNRLLVTCGGDFHADTYHPKCGMFLPDTVKDHRDLRYHLLSGEEIKLCIQEPQDQSLYTLCVPRF